MGQTLAPLLVLPVYLPPCSRLLPCKKSLTICKMERQHPGDIVSAHWSWFPLDLSVAGGNEFPDDSLSLVGRCAPPNHWDPSKS